MTRGDYLMRCRLAALVLGGVLLMSAAAQADTIPFDSSMWQIEAQESDIAPYLGRESLKLKGGLAQLQDVDFGDGTIRFDMAFSNERSFAGVTFRMQDGENFEHFYLRPHQSGKPDANQYTPVFNGVSGWQLYHGEGFSAVAEYGFDRWTPVKIVVFGTEADVYVNDMDNPLFHIAELKRGLTSGAIGLNASSFAPAWFSNFSYEGTSGSFAESEKPEDATFDLDLVGSWEVSNTFDGGLLENRFDLDPEMVDELRWAPLSTEPGGFINIARLRRPGEGHNTVIARITVDSPDARFMLMEFGYSDSARVYLNGRLLYAGDNSYESRDFRYLGTIGLFDSVGLPLQAGQNEILIAVSEQFGGWGVMARLVK
jgi:hypothetical protein